MVTEKKSDIVGEKNAAEARVCHRHIQKALLEGKHSSL